MCGMCRNGGQQIVPRVQIQKEVISILSVKIVFVKRDMEVYMIEFSRICKPVLNWILRRI
jgi:hypothetical protein